MRVGAIRDGWTIDYWDDGSLYIRPPLGSPIILAPEELTKLIAAVLEANAKREEPESRYLYCCPLCGGEAIEPWDNIDGLRLCSSGHQWRMMAGGFALVDRA